MQTKKLLHLIFGFTILLQAAFFQIAMPNLVLCIGEDGHVAFEWRLQDSSSHHKDNVLPDLFTHSKKAGSAAANTNCSDINLHLHPSHAEHVQKKSNTSPVVNSIHIFQIIKQDLSAFPVLSVKDKSSSTLFLSLSTVHTTVLII